MNLIEILFPGLDKSDKRYSNKIADIDHLAGHINARRDIFVTDDKRLLRKSEIIKSHYGAEILTPKQCWKRITSTHNPLPIVETFRERWEDYTDFLVDVVKKRIKGKDRKKYKYFREQFLRTYPKFKKRLVNFRLMMKSQDFGRHQILNDSDLEDIRRDINPFRKYYAKPSLKETIIRLSVFWDNSTDDFANWIKMGMDDKRDLLIEFEGYLE